MAHWLLVGLGNPGARYQGNRHNIGFVCADLIWRHYNFAPWRQKFHGQLAEGQIGPHRVLLLKPETYMNESGRAVQAALQFHKFPMAQIGVFYDELDLPLGKIRVKQGGGSGGHNGIRDIDAHIGGDYWRIRIGIGHPGIKELVRHHVLQDFTRTEQEYIHPVCAALTAELPLFLAGDANRFMTKISLQDPKNQKMP